LIVLDTHAWVWWAGETGHLSADATRRIAEAEQIGVPTICCWEVAMLVSRGRLELSLDVDTWAAAALALPAVVELRLDARTATRAGALDREAFPGDPADRIVYATAVEHGAPLVSRDGEIATFDPARVLW
jgi:PIN domain nuclease of toxin-antitoxin system